MDVGSPQPDSPNHILRAARGLAAWGLWAHAAFMQMPQGARVAALLAAAPALLIAAVPLAVAAPWVIIAALAAYGAVCGWSTLAAHVTEAAHEAAVAGRTLSSHAAPAAWSGAIWAVAKLGALLETAGFAFNGAAGWVREEEGKLRRSQSGASVDIAKTACGTCDSSSEASVPATDSVRRRSSPSL